MQLQGRLSIRTRHDSIVVRYIAHRKAQRIRGILLVRAQRYAQRIILTQCIVTDAVDHRCIVIIDIQRKYRRVHSAKSVRYHDLQTRIAALVGSRGRQHQRTRPVMVIRELGKGRQIDRVKGQRARVHRSGAHRQRRRRTITQGRIRLLGDHRRNVGSGGACLVGITRGTPCIDRAHLVKIGSIGEEAVITVRSGCSGQSSQQYIALVVAG